MKKLFTFKTVFFLLCTVFLVSLVFLANTEITKAQDSELVSRLSGRILLQVESNGEAWYLNPDNNLRYFLNRPSDAFSIMRQLGLGISEDNYNIFKENSVPSKFSGRILLRVEASGEAYYVNPLDMTMHYLGRPADAFSVMRELGLGITNSNLDKIDRYNKENGNQGEEENNEQAEQRVITHKPSLMNNFSHIINITADIEGIDNILEKGILYKYTSTEDEQRIPSIEDNDQRVIDSSNSNTEINIDLSNLKANTYPYIRAYVIDINNKVHYGNIETIDSLGKLGTPVMPMSGGVSETVEAVEGNSEHLLTYTAPEEGGYLSLIDPSLVELPVWIENEEIPYTLTAAGSAVVDNIIYMLGGYSDDDGEYSPYIISYNSQNNTWNTEAEMDYGMANPMVVDVNEKLYIFGGMTDDNATSTVMTYDINTNEFTYLTEMNYSIINAFGGVYDNEIYVFGGESDDYIFEIYNIESNTWRSGGIMPTDYVFGTEAIVIDDVFYIIGGHDDWNDDDCSTQTLSYNPSTDTWNTLSNLPEGRAAGSLAYRDGNVYYIGGVAETDSFDNLDTIYIYNITSDAWIEYEQSLPVVLSKAITHFIGDELFVIGGWDFIFYTIDTVYSLEIRDEKLYVYQEIVSNLEDGTTIYAVAEGDYYFDSWSDGVTDNPRQDLNVSRDINVNAIFLQPQYFNLTYNAPERDASYSISEGGYVKLGAFPEWEEKEPLSTAHEGDSSAVIGDKIYLVNSDAFSVYDSLTDRWDDTKALMSTFREDAVIVSLNGKIYAIGGTYEDDASNVVERYDPESDTWEYVSNMNYERESHIGAVYDGKIYIIGGTDNHYTHVAYTEEYDPESNTWTVLPTRSPFTSVRSADIQIVDGIIYVFSPNTSTNLNNFYSYNILHDSWTILSDIPNIIGGKGASFYYDGVLYFLGGLMSGKETSELVYEYNIDSNSWTRLFNFPIKIILPGIETIGDYVYVIGGKDVDSNSIDTNYKQNILELKNSFAESVSQTVLAGNNSVSVFAIFEPGYKFVSWSDGVTDNPRTDTNINNDIEVEAIFIEEIPDFSNPADSLILEFNAVIDKENTGKIFLPVADRDFPFYSDGENSQRNYYNFIVDWGDGSDPELFKSTDGLEKSHTYDSAGNYDVSISGVFPHIDFNNTSGSLVSVSGGSSENLISVKQWGDVDILTFRSSFNHCYNLSSIPDGPITGAESVTDFSAAFADCTFTSVPSNLFDNTPNVLNFNATFSNNSLTSIPEGLFASTLNVTDFSHVFSASNLTSIPAHLFDNNEFVEDFSYAFSQCALTSIPSGLFDYTHNVTDFRYTFQMNSLTSIPDGLFDHTPDVISFASTFFENSLTSIPVGLFDNNTKVESFQYTFYRNELTTIPNDLFINTNLVSSFKGTFRENLISSIPVDLFKNTTKVTNFTYTFESNNLTSIPDGLFDNTREVTSFAETFSENNIVSIPSGLFDNTPDVTNFGGIFYENSLTSLPSGLFDYTTKVDTFDSAFILNSLTSIPLGLFNNTTLVTSFYGTFYSNQSLTGLAPELWNMFPSADGRNCFYNDINLDNYDTIPNIWKSTSY